MRNHAMEGLPSPLSIKVHARLYSELLNLVGLVSKIIPEIEDARPRDLGMEALGLLHHGITKAKSLLQRCSECSVLYLVLTGEEFLSRCKKSRNLLVDCLVQIQNKVSVVLAAKISVIILALRRAAFCLDSSEKKAGELLWELLHRYGSTIDSTDDFALSAIHAICSLLHISSPRALVIEKRSIRKQLDSVGEADQNKRKLLRLFLRLVDSYRKLAPEDQKHNGSMEPEDNLSFASPCNLSCKVEPHASCCYDEAGTNMLNRSMPPKEFVCSLSSKLMHDPVVIASGETYERMWIKKWFDEGQDRCPKTKVKLENFSFTENTGLRNLISSWCATNGLSTPNARVQDEVVKPWENSTDSFASLSRGINDLSLPSDFSTSFGSSQGPDCSCTKTLDIVNPSHEASALPFNSSCSTIENTRRLLKISDASWSMMPFEKLIRLLLKYLKDAHDHHDVVAQTTGCNYLLELVQKYGNSASYLKEDAYCLLTSFLDTHVSKQALSILEVLSSHQQCGHRIAASGALASTLNTLESQDEELLQLALNILSNLSANSDICSFIMPSNFLPKLLPLFETRKFARYCVTILKNLCDTNGQNTAHIAETDGCIASIGKLLESGSHAEQECSLSILLSLCSEGVRYCQMIMDDGVISGLFDASINGNEKVKAMSLRLIHILEDKQNAMGGRSSCM